MTVEDVRNQALKLQQFKSDVVQLRKMKELSLQQGLCQLYRNYRNFTLLEKYLPFGQEPDCLKVKFVWACAFTKTERESWQPQHEAFSSLYNFAVAQMREAVYMDLAGDGIKLACRYFQQCAWVFERLMPMVGIVLKGVITPDLTKEALEMNKYLCLAQAQYLFFRTARDQNMSPVILSKICAQTADYFQKAYEFCQINHKIAACGNFGQVLGYHAKFYKACSWMYLAVIQISKYKETTKGCGIAVTLCKVTCVKFEDAKPQADMLVGVYKETFNKIYASAVSLRDTTLKDNANVYYDQEAKLDEIPKPEAQSFVQCINIQEELSLPQQIESKLQQLVPPAVQIMQQEIKSLLEEIVQTNIMKAQQANEHLKVFLQQLGLPNALYLWSNELPQDVWSKIESYQKMPLDQRIESTKRTRTECESKLLLISDRLGDEKTPGNMKLKESLQSLQDKLAQAQLSDQQIKNEPQELLMKTKQQLTEMMPQPDESNPVISMQTKCYNEIIQLGVQKDTVLQQGISMHDSLNIMDDLMKVARKVTTQAQVVDQVKGKYQKHFGQLDEIEQQRQQLSQVLAQNQDSFVKMVNEPSSRALFFQKIQTCLNNVQAQTASVGASEAFYSQLQVRVQQLEQQTSDYCITLNM